MAPPSKPAKKAPSGKKEKIFHPSSRKAGQLVRKAHRTDKLKTLASKRKEKNGLEANFYAYFHHFLPDEGTLTLSQLHELIRDGWLPRHDGDLATEKAQRRPGRPKSKKELDLEDEKLRELEDYRTGIEVIDMTHEANVVLFRLWNQKDVAYIDLLRFIRIFSGEPERFIVSRPGRHVTLTASNLDQVMDEEDK